VIAGAVDLCHHLFPVRFAFGRCCAGRFAAKEAFLKALGTEIIEQMYWTKIETLASRSGQPIATISSGALTRLRRLAERGRDAAVHGSISHDARLATAFAVPEVRYRSGGC